MKQCHSISCLKFFVHLYKNYACILKVCSLDLWDLFWQRHFSLRTLFLFKMPLIFLEHIGALDDKEELTPLGSHLCTLPLDPNIGKMLLMGSIFQCLNPALTIAAALAHRDPFVLPLNRKEEADAAKRSFAGDSCSDHIALLKAFEGWKDAKRYGKERNFCWENFSLQ
ncbi:RNA helicase [Bertholletia excelsa]